jgi:hypothetical protein
MRTLWKSMVALPMLSAAVFAGALTLEIGNPAANPEAQAKGAVVVARITACHSPEKTTVTASAEGVVNGTRKSIPLKVMPLSTAGTFAITPGWPEQGDWAVRMIAMNPEYKNYSTGVVVPIENNSAQLAKVKHYYHAPTEDEVLVALHHTDLKNLPTSAPASKVKGDI